MAREARRLLGASDSDPFGLGALGVPIVAPRFSPRAQADPIASGRQRWLFLPCLARPRPAPRRARSGARGAAHHPLLVLEKTESFRPAHRASLPARARRTS